ncbi:MAG: cbb3-type cytochrome c oxidase subunit I [Deltaproteobacteria bacterium]|nr:cbb3-type cytochrome c oxidase subunit I [Deltaproteobacteria bacterium]
MGKRRWENSIANSLSPIAHSLNSCLEGIILMNFINQKMEQNSSRLVYAWLSFAVSSLIFAGIFAFFVAMARTPVIQNIFPGHDYIRVALVGHVILSVVIWFLAFQGVLWTLSTTKFLNIRPFSMSLAWLGFWFSVSGTLLVIIAALFALGIPLFINYIPVLTHPVFYMALIVLAAGIFITLLNTFLTVWKAWKEKTYTGAFPLLTFSMAISGIAVLTAIVCFGLSYYFQMVGASAKILLDFEALFWGGGHILQFANTVAMVTAWLFLASVIFKKFPIKESYAKVLYAVYLLFVLPAPFIYFIYDTASQGYKDAFTSLMQYGLGPSTGIFAIAILIAVITSSKGNGKLPWKDPLFSSLVISMIVFAFGGFIALMIYGSNTKIPSHYHGVIGGVTLAFMGLTNHIIYILKRDIYSIRLARIQPYIYGTGQTLFVIGMFLAGSHGVQRKTFGAAQNLDDIAKVAGMAIVGVGGLIAITGGIIFVVNSILSLTGHKKILRVVDIGDARAGSSN